LHETSLSFTWRYPILKIKKTDSASPLLPPNTFVILPSPSCPHYPTLYPPTPHPSHLAKRPFQHHPTCSTLSSLYLPVPPTPPYPLPHALISLLPHICSIPFHTIRILSEPHKSTPRHQDMELSISKLSTSPSFNPQVSAPLCLLSFPTVQESGTPPLFAHQGAAPVLPCPGSCLSLELSLDAPPQETIQSPLLKQVIAPELSHLGSCLSLELCLGVPPQESFPHPTFLLTWVPQPRAGHRVTFALVPSSKEFGFTHTKPFSDFNRPDHQHYSHSLYHPTSLIHVEDTPIPHDIHHTTLFNPNLSIENFTTPPLLCTTLLSLPTPTEPLPIPPQPAPNKPTIHGATLSYPHTSTQPTTFTPWFLLLTILLFNFAFFSHFITFNTYPFQFLHEIFQPSPVLTTSLGPHHDKLLLFNTMSSTHPDCVFSSTVPVSSTTPPTTFSTTTTSLPPPPPQPPPDPPSPPDCVVDVSSINVLHGHTLIQTEGRYAQIVTD